ncbi:hypothetical protein, partial [Pediococcus pentosaceus]|uniref:hypothetical protein n=1 Tax=Pediococcus pentosaceus TaxID=1255 RepID=UPI003981C908
ATWIMALFTIVSLAFLTIVAALVILFLFIYVRINSTATKIIKKIIINDLISIFDTSPSAFQGYVSILISASMIKCLKMRCSNTTY